MLEDPKPFERAMTFDNLHRDTECLCTEHGNEDTTSLFGIKTNKNFLRIADFNSKWDKGMNNGMTDCKDVCSYKGVSMSVVSNANVNCKAQVIEIYKQLFPLAPGYKPFISIIKFKESSGVIKVTPLENNPYHHDFYKADSFSLDFVELIECISLAENV